MTVSLQEAKAKLEELFEKALAGETIEILDDGRKAKLVSDDSPEKRSSLLGSQKGVLIYMSDDFNEPLDDFKEYME